MVQSGADYLASLNDGRRVVLGGELVTDVTAHPAFRVAHEIAALYDSLPETNRVETEAGPTHAAFAIPHTRDDLRAQRDAILAWQRQTRGWVGRTPDTLASVLVSVGAEHGFFGDQSGAARGTWMRAAAAATQYAQALVNPPVDRTKAPDDIADIVLHVVEERSDGVIVSGAKAVVTGAATAQRIFVSHFGGVTETAPFSFAATVPVNAPGLTLYARRPYLSADPGQQPLASRYEENDCMVVFDRVFVPHDDILIRDQDTMRGFNEGRVGWSQRLAFQAACRVQAKLEYLLPLVHEATKIAGTDEIRAVQSSMGELLALRNTVAGLRDAMIEQAEAHPGGIRPGFGPAMAFAAMAPDAYSNMRIRVQTMLSSVLAHVPASLADLDGEHGAVLRQYLRGSNGTGASERIDVVTQLWDALGSEFGARHELYERSFWGPAERTHFGLLRHANATGLFDAWRASDGEAPTATTVA